MLKADNAFDLMQFPLARLLVGLAIGLGGTIAGGIQYYKATTLPKHGVEAEGTVVSLLESRGRKSQLVTYTPVVAFQDANGQEYQAEMTGNGRNQVGDKVTILYLPNNPKTADIKGTITGASVVFAFISLGVGLIGWAAVLYNVVFMVRTKRIL